MKDFRNLKVWQKAHSLTLDVYKITSRFPKEELYGLTSQIRRASSSIPANIAEGCGKGSDADFKRFLQIAMGSASESEYHLMLARDLNMTNGSDYNRLHNSVVEIKQMLSGLISKLIAER